MQIVRQLDEQVWRDFVANHPQGQIFHAPEMFQVFARVEGHKPTLWAVVDDGHYPLALLLPVEITLKSGLLYRWTTRAVAYGSVLCAPGPDGTDALRMLVQAYRREMRGKILFTELRNLTDLSELQPALNECDFVFEEHLNYLIDLDQPEETLWRRITKSGRQSVRTSQNKGTRIEEVTERQQLAIAYQLLQEVYARVGVPLASLPLFEAAFDILAPRGMFKVFVACANDQYIGTCLLLIFNGRITDWYAGSDRAFSAYCSGESLIWHALQWGKAHGLHMFDFGGAGKPEEDYGPRRFKAKFNGTPVNYGRNICVHAPLSLSVSKAGYLAMRKLLSLRSRAQVRNDAITAGKT
jgi:CelD/BcsL family acetyltransferase involved in cellulose biosynthesis